MNQEQTNKVIIIGSGPAAYTAAIYASRAELKPLLFEGDMSTGMTPGGQLTTTTDVENFPGFTAINGFDLVENMKQQAQEFGTLVIPETITNVDLENKTVTSNTSKTYKYHSLIIATGANAKRLESLPNLDKFWNKGISACAVCDGALPLFRNKPLVVVGGGDSAMEEATFLTKYASKVYIIVRRDVLRASKTMQTRALKNPKIEFLFNTNVSDTQGTDFLEKITVQLKDKKAIDLQCNGLFFAIGHQPASQLFTKTLLMNKAGYLITKPDSTQVLDKNMDEVPGVFACGDVQDFKWRQAITAAGTGCMSALEAEHYLGSLE